MSQCNAEAVNNLFRKIVQRSTGGTDFTVDRMTGGVVNQVFHVRAGSFDRVFRLNENCLDVFNKERWAMRCAQVAGVNVPAVSETDELNGIAYMVMQYIPGTSLKDFAGDRTSVLNDLGRQLRLINNIPVQGFGFHLDRSGRSPRFTQSWAELINEELEMILKDDALIKIGALTREQLDEAVSLIKERLTWNSPASLCHGDASADNVIVQAGGTVVIIDWTQTKGGVAPYYDLASWSADPADFEAVCAGYGVDHNDAQLKARCRCVLLTDALRAAGWAYSVNHPQIGMFAEKAKAAFQHACG